MPIENLKKRLIIEFKNEEGIDAGGLTREFYNELVKDIFKTERGLFKHASNESTYMIDAKSEATQDYEKHFNFIGRIIGKALY